MSTICDEVEDVNDLWFPVSDKILKTAEETKDSLQTTTNEHDVNSLQMIRSTSGSGIFNKRLQPQDMQQYRAQAVQKKYILQPTHHMHGSASQPQSKRWFS